MHRSRLRPFAVWLMAGLSGPALAGGCGEDGAARQRAELARAEGMAARCALVPSAVCAALPGTIEAMHLALGRFARERRARRGGCAASLVARTPGLPAGRLETRPPPRDSWAAAAALRRRIEREPLPANADAGPVVDRPGRFRTHCVRSCDGYHWPISYAAPSAAFARDADTCRAACPNQETTLFVQTGAAGGLQSAVSLAGERYADLPNANRFRTRFHPQCQCGGSAAPDGLEVLRAPPEAADAVVPEAPAPAGEVPASEVPAGEVPARRRAVPVTVNTNDATTDRGPGVHGLRGVGPARALP